jgi:hypothetical protein
MAEDDTAKTDTPGDPKTINHQADVKSDPVKQHARTEQKFEGSNT